MGYSYQSQRPSIFTEDGQVMFLSIRDRTRRLMEQAGAAMLAKIIHGESGDTWAMMACVDRLVELGEIREVTTNGEVMGQHRVFVPMNRS